MYKKLLKGWTPVLLIVVSFAVMGQSCPLVPNEAIYVIGGYGWKARFIDQDGYVVTDGVYGVNGQYNLENEVLRKDAEWVAYESEQELPGKPYNCGTCHTTGYAGEEDPPLTGYIGSATCSGCHPDVAAIYDEHGHGYKLNAVDGGAPEYPFSAVPNTPVGFIWGTTPADPFSLPGIVGTWTEPGIGCEACHGPGAEHQSNPVANKTPEDPTESCVKCHIRGDYNEIDTSKGLIKHHEQYEMWLASPHKSASAPDCLGCHDGHASVVRDEEAAGVGTKIIQNADCLVCHGDDNPETGPDVPETIGLNMEGLLCIDCHMPFAVKSATSITLTAPDDAEVKVGDLRAHIWKINAAAESPDDFFTEDGSFVAVDNQGNVLGLTMNFVCQQCHSEGGITPRGLPAATPYTFDQCTDFATMIH